MSATAQLISLLHRLKEGLEEQDLALLNGLFWPDARIMVEGRPMSAAALVEGLERLWQHVAPMRLSIDRLAWQPPSGPSPSWPAHLRIGALCACEIAHRGAHGAPRGGPPSYGTLELEAGWRDGTWRLSRLEFHPTPSRALPPAPRGSSHP